MMFPRIVRRWSMYRNSKDTQDFIAHNRKVFDRSSRPDDGQAEILLELNGIRVAQIGYAYFTNYLADRHNAKITAYAPTAGFNFVRRLDRKILEFLCADEFGVYKSFGTTRFVTPLPTGAQCERAKRLFREITVGLKSKRDVEKIEVNGVLLGDLIYDTYLRDCNRPTIILDDPEFLEFLEKSLQLYAYWEEYFETRDIKAVVLSHCVYNNAFPLRIAVTKNIDAYQVNDTHVYKMNRDHLFAYTDFADFHKEFIKLPGDIRSKGIAKAKERIDLRFSGEVGVDMPYSTMSAWKTDQKDQRLIKVSSKTKILVAAHCFFDSPHPFGMNLFPDFVEWIEFLGKISEETDYEWYIKTHPDYKSEAKHILDEFVKKYPKFTHLPSDSSHHQIISEGIDLALTCYGTIGFEYAAQSVPVINASINNPHIGYAFNHHPKDLTEYEVLLRNLDDFKMNIHMDDVYEFYFMSRIHNTNDWLFKSYEKLIKSIWGAGLTQPIVYRMWLNDWSKEHHDRVIQRIERFIESGAYRMSYDHIANPKAAKVVR
jgi:hypothetical protein